MNLTELIMSANTRGHIGVRREAIDGSMGGVVDKALSLDLIKLVSAWTSTEDDLPERWGGPVDRRVYALTRKGWDLKVNTHDAMSSYSVTAFYQAQAAHWGELDEGPDLRYPEEAFNDWADIRYRMNETIFRSVEKLADPPLYATPKHQHPRGPMPNTIIDPPLVLHEPLYNKTEAEAVDTPYPGHELAVPDDHWVAPRHYDVLGWTYIYAVIILVALAVFGWWLS